MQSFVKRWQQRCLSWLKGNPMSSNFEQLKKDVLKRGVVDVQAKKELEKTISPSTATWNSLRDQAALKEHFRDKVRGVK